VSSPLPQTNPSKRLTFGALFGPFLIAALHVVALKLLGWPYDPIVNRIIFALPVLFGSICFYFVLKQRNESFLLLIPYVLGYSFFGFVFIFFLSFTMGAPK